MKILLISLALIAAPALAAESFEVDSQGCLFSKTHASCVITNRLPFDTSCKISILARTEGKRRVISTREVMIPARRFQTIEVFSPEKSPIRAADASGVCTVIE